MNSEADIRDYNRRAWNKLVDSKDQWTVPVSSEVIAAARHGQWEILLTETKSVPRSWLPELDGRDVLCLASGGGQQAPVLAAAGARVTVLDNSPKQLEQDRFVAERESLDVQTVEGDMTDLSPFADASFDLVFHPVSNLFVPDVRPVWREAFRVLRSGGSLLAGFVNPVIYLFAQQLIDHEVVDGGGLQVKHMLPYSDLLSLSEQERQRYLDAGVPLEFGHSLTNQIGGQVEAGFMITGFYEDRHRTLPIAEYSPTYVATRAIKP